MTGHAKAASIEPRRVTSGNYTDTCEDCGATIVAATADEVLGASCACHQQRTTQHLVELACLMCGRAVGTLTVARVDARILIPRGLRCDPCGGQLVVSDVFAVSVYPNLPRMHVKRGRPPGTHQESTNGQAA
ncbi:MAG: hypothetical protein JO352_03595 [Chloroflexi bacterium]|nr:hypothetical protein [Chloroflexota bacterium]MBV9602890.1 hypothetical protein [Chloroflexota bacterium]